MSKNLAKTVFIGFVAGVCLSAQLSPATIFAMTKCSRDEESCCDPACEGCRKQGCRRKNCWNREETQSDGLSKEEAFAEEKLERKSAAKKALEDF